MGWQERWLAPLVLCLGLGGGLLAIARPGQPLSPEKIIAMLVSTVLCILLWKRYSARLLGALRQHQAMRQAPLQGLLRKLVRAGLRARLRRMEGGYRLQLDDQGFTLIHDRGARERLEWAQIARLRAILVNDERMAWAWALVRRSAGVSAASAGASVASVAGVSVAASAAASGSTATMVAIP